MIKINLDDLGVKKALTLDDSVIASFVTGSFVNGYFRNDSDIDIVAVSSKQSKPLESLDEKISLHYLHESTLSYFQRARFYSVLRNVPLLNSGYVHNLSIRTKREMIMTESKKLQKLHEKNFNKGQVNFSSWDIISRYFTRQWGVIEPWRLKTLKRMLDSSQSREILEGEYQDIFDSLLKEGFLIREGGNYSISEKAILNEDMHETSSPIGQFRWLFRESHGGLLYLANAPEIVRNVKKVYFPRK